MQLKNKKNRLWQIAMISMKRRLKYCISKTLQKIEPLSFTINLSPTTQKELEVFNIQNIQL